MSGDLSPDQFRGELSVVLANTIMRYASGDAAEVAKLAADVLMQLAMPMMARMNEEQREAVLLEADGRINACAELFADYLLVVVWATLAGLLRSVGEHQLTDNPPG